MTFRELPAAEWNRLLIDEIEPFASAGLPDPDHAVILAAEADGRILGVSLLVEGVMNHWSLAPDARHSPSMVAGLWEATRRTLDERGVPVIHTTVADAQTDVQAMVERLGYVPADGTLYVMDVASCILNERAG